MRNVYQLTDEQYDRLVDASKPVPYMIIGGIEPAPAQENANNAWRTLGEELNFKWETVEPSSKGKRFFTAEEK